MFRRLIRTIVLLVVLYFIIGFFVVQYQLITNFSFENYNKYGAILGGIASVCGILAFSLPTISTKDLKELELESLKKIVDLSEEMRTTENLIEKKSKEVDQLELHRKQIGLLVRKASLKIYLEDKYKKNNSSLISIFHENKNIENQLRALGEEIVEAAEKEIIKEIEGIVKKSIAVEPTTELVLSLIPGLLSVRYPTTNVVERFANKYDELFYNLYNIIFNKSSSKKKS